MSGTSETSTPENSTPEVVPVEPVAQSSSEGMKMPQMPKVELPKFSFPSFGGGEKKPKDLTAAPRLSVEEKRAKKEAMFAYTKSWQEKKKAETYRTPEQLATEL